ncbi:Xaa-Pro aminopeptidase [Psychrobacter ciconiae]|uniref:Xaa-Pro aminopeptidase n=1 Tax=Psychrobacter ciconiae TaxID=1553449 RepID=UPI001D1222C7|nr:Xaa-Pro aminopeptidase [Psychrobacter ciconiae]
MNKLFAAVGIGVIVVSGCQSMPQQGSAPIANPIVNQMPIIDKNGLIAYVEEEGIGASKVSSLYIIRPDGSNRELIDRLNGYIYAPSWSFDGTRLAYSKQAMREAPKIFIYDKASKSSKLMVSNKGSNLSAAFSPDGQKLIFSSTMGGNADIYEQRLSDGAVTQLTRLPSTEVQPSYAADGQSVIYVSDKARAGRPRLYRQYLMADGKVGRVVPISTAGYAASPMISLDGSKLGFLNGKQAAVMTLSSVQVVNLGDTGLDEPARLSPSSQYAVYPMQNAAINGQTGSSLVIRPLSGSAGYTISSKTGGVIRAPSWGR